MAHSDRYTREEDALLWEIHEARHGIMKEIEADGIEQFNREVRKSFPDVSIIGKDDPERKKKIG